MPAMSDMPRVSVVIATLGGPSLPRTIEHLNAGTVAPAEILIAIPREEAPNVASLRQGNVRVVETPFRGQVAQRVAGFAQVANDLVMQIDDDIVVEPDCIERLVQDIEGCTVPCAVAPALKWLATRESVYKEISPQWLAKLFFWLLNGRRGYRPGSVTTAGAEIGVCWSPTAGTIESEWLAGGCVLHRRANLVLENYFPFEGKAYCEDLIHSHHLRKRNVRLFVSTRAVAYLEAPPEAASAPRAFVRGLRGDFQARRYYVELSSGSKLRLYLFFLARIMRRVLRS